jgi:hypothetical protein
MVLAQGVTMNPQEPWLVPFLRKIYLRPGAYLGSEDVHALALYIFAYSSAREDLGFAEFGAAEKDVLSDFEKWLAMTANMSDTRGWPGLIARIDPSVRSVHTFLRLFDEFLKASGRSSVGLDLAKKPSENIENG